MLKSLRQQVARLGRSGVPILHAGKQATVRGHVDRVARGVATGWVVNLIDDEPLEVQVLLKDEVLAAGLAEELRSDVAEQFDSSGRHGFRLSFDAVNPSDLPLLKIYICSSGEKAEIPITNPAYLRSSGEAMHDDADSSSERELVEALRLDRVFDETDEQPLKGKSVLVLGSGKGGMCQEVSSLGAERVLGIERSKRDVAKARKRYPSLEFQNSRWNELPDDKFDLVLVPGVLHLEENPKLLVDEIYSILSDEGVLVIQCGMVRESGARAWHTISGKGGVFRFPTHDLMIFDVLSRYSVRVQSSEYKVKAVPVSQAVLHCSPKKSTAILIAGKSRSGKSNLSFYFTRRDIPTFATDSMLSRMLKGRRYEWSTLGERVSKEFGKKSRNDLGKVARFIVEEGLEEMLCELIVAEVPKEAEVFSIQGEALRYPSIQQALVNKLEKSSVRAWVMLPASEVNPS